jgi:hypothetical protein
MSFRACIVAAAFAAVAAPAFAQQSCLHDTNESPEQAARRKQALQATRTVNNIQAISRDRRQPCTSSTKIWPRRPSPFVQRDTKRFTCRGGQ